MNRPALDQALKERFFALYWRQKIMSSHDWIGSSKDFLIVVDPQVGKREDWFIFLRSVDQLTDEEAIQVAKIMKVEKSDFWTDQFRRFRVYIGDPVSKELDYEASFAKAGRQYVNHFFRTTKWSDSNISYYEEGLIVWVADYLRSISIALPFMGYSVDELIEAGFLKLKNDA